VARSIWALTDEEIAEHVSLLDIPSAKQWLFALMETLSRDNFARVAITLWAIWYTRQKMIHEEQFQSPLSTHLFIESYLWDLSIAGSSTVQGQKTPKAKHPRWTPPVRGYAKLNVDAAMAKSRPGGAVGVVCWDESGSFLGASMLTVQGISDPAIMEAIACREALALTQDLHLRRVTVASDYLAVVNDLSRHCAGSYSMVLSE
jgi:hypothetical protein